MNDWVREYDELMEGTTELMKTIGGIVSMVAPVEAYLKKKYR